MSDIRTYELIGNWFIAKDGNNSGISKGWTSSVPEAAIECSIPSIIQQYFPEYHGVAFYF